MKKLFVFLSLLFCIRGGAQTEVETWLSSYDPPLSEEKEIISSIQNLKGHLEILAADSFEGRCTATEGQKKAADYLASRMEHYRLVQIAKDSNGELSWYQSWPFAKRFGDKKKYLSHSENVMGVLPATTPSDEYIVISAHYDHLGIIRDTIYNGADDNGTGTSSLLELIRLFSSYAPERDKNILFIFFSGEEKGLLGSKYFAENPVVPLEKIVCDLNIDMVGRADSTHQADSNYVYVIGSNRISTTLDSLLQAANRVNPMELDYTYNDPKDPQRLYERSDHFNFAKHGIPVAFFFSGLHADYHKSTDDIEKINFEVLYRRMMLVYRLTILVMNHEGTL
ncbi:MAG TPA: peptidase M28 [Bacteroidetes bacterium]|nr:peptidase M28 [Bacteroidota bacterium]